MAKLEYVASGMSHSRIILKDAKDPVITSMYKRAFDNIKNGSEQDFSLLYNAYTEGGFPKTFDLYKDHIHNVHADSGGLQIITCGLEVTAAMKTEVYRNQAENSEIAMSFDEIPLQISGKSSRNDVNTRLFDTSLIEEKARHSGRNLFKQLKLFEKMDSKSKPMMILQGNDYDSFMRWTEFVMDEIPPEYYERIAGVAISGACHGAGLREDAQRAFYFKHIPFEMKNPYLHILGAGSIRRLLPFILFMNNGFYDDNVRISYDSTTHTSAMTMGRYYHNGKTLRIGKYNNKPYDIMYNDLNHDGWLDEWDIDKEEMIFLNNSNTSIYKNKEVGIFDKELMYKFFALKTGFFYKNILNFMQEVDGLKIKKNMNKFTEKIGVTPLIHALSTVDDLPRMIEWEKMVGKAGISKLIPSVPSTLNF